MAIKEKNIVAVEPIKVEHATVFIEGDGDLVLNKMNARVVRELTAARDGKSSPNKFQTSGRTLLPPSTGGTEFP